MLEVIDADIEETVEVEKVVEHEPMDKATPATLVTKEAETKSDE